MKEITEDRCMEMIIEKLPNVSAYLEKFNEDFGPDMGITIQMIPFAEYTVDALRKEDDTELKKIFELVEFLLDNGNEAVKDAMATGYLECLMHKDPDKIKFRGFVKFMGSHSIEYCRAWDEFTGCRTDGLWDEKVG